MRLRYAGSPNPGSLLPFAPPEPRSLSRSEVALVSDVPFRRTSARSVSDAMPATFPALRSWPPAPEVRDRDVSPSSQTAALIVIEPKPLATELFLKDPILFAKIVEGELLLLIHPSSNGDQQKPEWVENSVRLQSPLSPARTTIGATVDSCRSSFRTIRGRSWNKR